ncbi:hypothetical protein DFH01_25995 [Falsiroseomonas bella]|uniref:Phasin domain-containing protein n=1 Tax=Falsiroseomonas bella TaxID=2184016 RepID=A0A317F8W8_9PROT|nr:hypothetical protein [Falsiroseomonas bella]PWS34467.1 hypothetical protein DFH01_25995 [Falsiroseomonas bella]
MSSNPFLSQWLSAANAAAGAWRGFWTAEFARQQAAMATEWQRQTMQFWTQAMTATMQGATVAPARSEPAAPMTAEPLPAPQQAADEPAEAPAEEKPAPAPKRPVPARAATQRVKAQAKRGPARTPSRRGPAATRH